VGQLGQPEAGALGGDADVAQQRPLERAAHHPTLAGHDDRGVEVPQPLDGPVGPPHQLVVGQLGLQVADRRHVPPRRERAALAPPHHGPDVGPLGQLGDDGEQLGVHVVVEGVVLVRVVVGDRRDRPVDLESHGPHHPFPLSSPVVGRVVF
jgi:hypothetical protein